MVGVSDALLSALIALEFVKVLAQEGGGIIGFREAELDDAVFQQPVDVMFGHVSLAFFQVGVRDVGGSGSGSVPRRR